MVKGRVSIVIPAKNEMFLSRTIQELLEKAEGDIEIIASLDSDWPKPTKHGVVDTPAIIDDPRVNYIHHGSRTGMRGVINSAVALARGEYIMKIDAHCMVDQGYDVKLKADCEDNWVVIPRRKRLDAENWCIQDVGKPDVDYNFLSFPDNPADFGGAGLNGRIWTEKIRERLNDPQYDIDDELSFQGSCWFMKRDYFYFLELMDEENYGPFWNEAQEIGFKAWLSGGRVVRNKKTWYAHLHKGKKYGRGYFLDKNWATQGASYALKWLTTDKMWHKQIYPLKWLLKKFMPMPGWPEDESKWLPQRD